MLESKKKYHCPSTTTSRTRMLTRSSSKDSSSMRCQTYQTCDRTRPWRRSPQPLSDLPAEPVPALQPQRSHSLLLPAASTAPNGMDPGGHKRTHTMQNRMTCAHWKDKRLPVEYSHFMVYLKHVCVNVYIHHAFFVSHISTVYLLKVLQIWFPDFFLQLVKQKSNKWSEFWNKWSTVYSVRDAVL